MSVCQYKFKNGTICGTRTQSLYCEHHGQIKREEDTAERIAQLERERDAWKMTATNCKSELGDWRKKWAAVYKERNELRKKLEAERDALKQQIADRFIDECPHCGMEI